jgi:acyl-CoA thioester hydrolase
MEKRIFYHDTDSGGIVYYGNYLKYLEEARTEFLEHKGMSVEMFSDRGLLYAVRNCTITYRSPARYGDILICDAKLVKITAAQLIFEQTIHQKKTGVLTTEAQVTLACLNKDFKPTQIPEDLKERLLMVH